MRSEYILRRNFGPVRLRSDPHIHRTCGWIYSTAEKTNLCPSWQSNPDISADRRMLAKCSEPGELSLYSGRLQAGKPLTV
jgi:hypothetical protein